MFFIFGYEGEESPSTETPVSKTFSQEEVNRINAEEKRRRKAAEDELKQKNDLIEQLRNQHSMTETEKAELAAKIEEFEKAKMTEKERLDHEMAKIKKQSEEKEKDYQSKLDKITRERDDLIVTRAIRDAAMEGKVVAADGTGNQVLAVLRHSATVNESGEVIIKGFQYVDDGKSLTADLPVGEAIAKMKESESWVNFWKDPSIKGFPDPYNSSSRVSNEDPKDWATWQKLRSENKLAHQKG